MAYDPKNPTIIYYLNQLPEPYRSEALENYDFSFAGNQQPTTPIDALAMAFDWRKSKQGHTYWLGVKMPENVIPYPHTRTQANPHTQSTVKPPRQGYAKQPRKPSGKQPQTLAKAIANVLDIAKREGVKLVVTVEPI